MNMNEYSYPTGGNRKWVCGVEASLPIINWKIVTKDGHLEMLNHGVHHLPVERQTQLWIDSHLEREKVDLGNGSLVTC